LKLPVAFALQQTSLEAGILVKLKIAFFGGLTCVSYLHAQSSFRLQSEWVVAGGIIKRL
jgi:hypothetical protein